MPVSPSSDTDPVVLALPPRWQRVLPPAAALVAGFAALCCLGLTALVSLLTAIGATFLTQDATLGPLLAVSLVVTIVASSFTWRRHRNPLPLLLTVVAAVIIFWSLYGGALFGHAASGHGDHMGDPMPDSLHGAGHHGSPGGNGVWVGLALLITAQVWDIWRLRLLKRRAARAA
jgi:hypothetical protein